MNRFSGLFLLSLLFMVTACGGSKEEKPRLEGERISILEFDEGLRPDITGDITGLNIVAPLDNLFWPGPNGYSTNLMQNLAFDGKVSLLWKKKIGAGASSRFPLLSRPVIANQAAYVVDGKGLLSKVSLETGKEEWSVLINPRYENQNIIGGGIAYSTNRLFVSAGFNEVVAIDSVNGGLIWRYKTKSPVRAAPTVVENRVFVTTADSETLAIHRDTGKLLWRHSGLSENVRIMGASGPAVSRHLAVIPYPSGELYALRTENGKDLWTQNLNARRGAYGSAFSDLGDIQASPVVEGGIIYAMNFSGVLTAIEARTGSRIWQQNIGGIQTPWIVGDFIFVLSDDNILNAMNKKTGQLIWTRQLDADITEKEKKKGPISFYGPVMAGNTLYVVSSHGVIYSLDPLYGELSKRYKIKEKVASAPVIASKTMLIVTQKGNLLAFH